MKLETLLLSMVFVFGMAYSTFASFGTHANLDDPFSPEIVVAHTDTIPLKERYGDFTSDPGQQNPFDLKDPSIIEKSVDYDPVSGQYIITEKIGDDYFRMPSYMTFDEYMDYRAKEEEKAYFDELAGISTGGGGPGGLDPMTKIDVKDRVKDRLFGGNIVDIRPQGNIDLTFGVEFNSTQNPALSRRQQRQGGFDFDMDIQMNVTGKIGEKLNLSTNYNTQATFDFDNQLKLEYNSDVFGEDDIIKTIEAGNVTFPLQSSLIQGSQSLFGLRTELQFGRLKIGAVASQQRSSQESIQIQGGSQVQEFSVNADQYDENRHFFLTHYNRAVFESALVNLPQIRSLFKVLRIEVWITNDRNETQNQLDIVALADLGEPQVITNNNPNYQAPANIRNPDISGLALPGQNLMTGVDANDLFEAVVSDRDARELNKAVANLENNFGFVQSRDFERVGARILSANEYTLHPELGFISLNVNLQPDQVLAVAFEYEYNGQTFQVGEFNKNVEEDNDILQVRYMKMLKSTTQRVDVPTWDLMMKN
ncbi:MAG: cell surface protein SprA, partial [Bacteroidota bacterium]